MAEAAQRQIVPTSLHSPHTHTLLLMSAALGIKDRYTQAHGYRVALYAGRLAHGLNMSIDEVQFITLGGLLHDVGKLALSDRIFSNKTASLSKDMIQEVHNHPLIGAHLLERMNCSKSICDVVLYHHERMDGSGYPYGLAGNAIPIGAKIVSVADCFDAITTDRPYQGRKSCAEAISLLSEMGGEYLDKELVWTFLDEIRRNGMIQDAGAARRWNPLAFSPDDPATFKTLFNENRFAEQPAGI